MTEKANPSINRPATAFQTAGAIAYGGHGSASDPGFVVDGANPTELSVQDQGIDETALDTFTETSSASSYTVTINPGEAFVFGSWIVKDTSIDINLDVSTAGQTVYVGWNKNGTNDVIVGKASAFASATGDTDLKIPLWTFDTDGSGVSNVTDERSIGYTFGSLNVDGTLDVTGSTTLNDTLDVTGATTLGGALDLNSNLDVSGVSTFTSEVNVDSTLDVDGMAQVSDDLVLNDGDGQQTLAIGNDGDTFRILQDDGTDFSTMYVGARSIQFDSNTGVEVTSGYHRAPVYQDSSGNVMMDSVVATGQVTLSGGSATVNTGISATDATFNLALGVDDPGSDVKVSGRLFWDDSANQYKIDIVETQTSVGNPTVNYDVIRVR